MTKKKRFHYAWVICFCCFIIMIFTTPLVNTLSSLYLKTVTDDLHISRSAFTFTSTLVAICGMLLSPFWGTAFSRKSMRIILPLTLLLFSLSYMSYSLAQNQYYLYFSAIFVGIAYSGCTFIPVSMLITSWFKKRRGLAMSIAFSGIGIGGSVFSQIVSKFITVYGWRITYCYIGLIVMVVVVPVTYFLLRPTPESMNLKPYGDDDMNGSTNTEKKGNVKQTELDISLADAKTKPFFWVHMMGMFLVGIICSAPLRQINPYVADLHGVGLAATIVSLYSFVGIFGKFILGGFNDKVGTMKASVFAFFLMALTFTLLLFGKLPMLLYAMGVVYGIGNGVGTILAPLLVSATFGTKSFHVMCGVTRSPLQLGMALGGLLLAAVFDITGSYTLGWGVCIILSILAAICFLWSYRAAGKMRSPQEIVLSVSH